MLESSKARTSVRTNTPPTPEVPAGSSPAPGGLEISIATGFGLGYAPWAPGTVASLGAVLLFALIHYGLEGAILSFTYLSLLVVLALAGVRSTENALPHWTTPDPRPIVIDEILGQWLTYGGLVAAGVFGLVPPGARVEWKSWLVGFILFRAFDVLKPFPIRRSERLPGAAGVLVDDVLAGTYAGLLLLLSAWMGWLR